MIDCNTGRASDGAGARLAFGAMALVNDTVLQLVKTETNRGLQGRALAGYHTGGRCFGYRTEPEPNPPDPQHPRAVLRVNVDEAQNVRRVGQNMFFELAYVNPKGLGKSSDGLPRQVVPLFRSIEQALE